MEFLTSLNCDSEVSASFIKKMALEFMLKSQ